jgi:dTDP-4-dehydrorhamnose 3,5-epimerase
MNTCQASVVPRFRSPDSGDPTLDFFRGDTGRWYNEPVPWAKDFFLERSFYSKHCVDLMNFRPTSIPDVIIVEPKVFGDERGFFMETYQEREFEAAGLPTHFVQDNHSGSRQGILRGLHYQLRHTQGKLVRAVAGEVFDVVVDIRKSSPTFGKWVGICLSAENKRQLWVPEGFAHGFYVMSEWAEFLYKVTDFYAPEWERTLAWNDPDIGVEWPLVNGQPPDLSKKDAAGTLFRDLEFSS